MLFSAEAGGGNCGNGALSAGFAQFAAPGINNIGGKNYAGVFARTMAAGVVGGTASELGGGKFANGAYTGAFGRLYNDEAGIKNAPILNV